MSTISLITNPPRDNTAVRPGSTKRHQKGGSQYNGEDGYGEDGGEEKERDEEAIAMRRHRREMFQTLPLTVSPFSGLTTNLVQCVIIREKGGGGLFLSLLFSSFFCSSRFPCLSRCASFPVFVQFLPLD